MDNSEEGGRKCRAVDGEPLEAESQVMRLIYQARQNETGITTVEGKEASEGRSVRLIGHEGSW